MLLETFDNTRFVLGGLCLIAILSSAAVAHAETPGDPCRERGSAYTLDVQAQYTENDLGDIGATVRSASASVRRCLSNGRSLTGGVYFDDIDVSQRGSTAARVLIGYLGRREGKETRKRSSYWVYGANATAGYEDYIVAEGWPPTFHKEQRSATSLEAVAGYAVLPHVDRLKQRNYLEQVYLDGRVAVFDKRAPSADAPAYATETYEAATGTLVLTYNVDHAPFGSKVDVLLTQQHLFSDTLRVDNISTARIQWRLQRDEQLDHTPDRLVIGLQASFGNNDYRVWSLSVGKSF